MVHQHVLERSPVLVCMTTGSFSEGIRKEIVLPEDDEDTFGRVVEHLYGNDDVAFDLSDLKESESANKLAQMYALAEKYELTGLKVRIVEELKGADLLKKEAIDFFETSRQIWQNTSDSDQIFQAYFEEQALIHLKCLPKEKIEELSEMVDLGGSFARKLVRIQAKLYHETQLTWISQSESSKKKSALEKEKLQSKTANFEASLAATKSALHTVQANASGAKGRHAIYHTGCRQCFI